MSIHRHAVVDYAEVIDPDAKPVGPIHPGVILDEEFLAPLGLSACALANAVSVPRNRITGIVHRERAITADTALRLARFLRHVTRFLAQPADGLRPRDRPRRASRPARAGSDSAGGLRQRSNRAGATATQLGR